MQSRQAVSTTMFLHCQVEVPTFWRSSQALASADPSPPQPCTGGQVETLLSIPVLTIHPLR